MRNVISLQESYCKRSKHLLNIKKYSKFNCLLKRALLNALISIGTPILFINHVH